MRRLTRLLITIVFPIALVAPAMSIALPVTADDVENRSVEPPAIDLASLLNPGFYREALAYLRDVNPLRTGLIRAGTAVDYWIFSESPNPQRVLRGNDGWLYLTETVTAGCTTSAATVVSNLEELISEIERSLSHVVVTVAPSKFTIVPENLTGDQQAVAKCGFRSSEELRSSLAGAGIEGYVDGWEIFESVKKSGSDPYFRTDTHFNYVGSIPWMRALISPLLEHWDEEVIMDLGTVAFDGNLTSFVGVIDRENVNRVVIERGVEQAKDDESGISQYSTVNSNGQPLIGGRAVIIGDSFMILPEPSLVQFFRSVQVIDWREEDSVELLIDELLRDDVAVLEISELDVWRLFGDRSIVQRYVERRDAQARRSDRD